MQFSYGLLHHTKCVSFSRTLTSSKLSYYAFTSYGYIINTCSTSTHTNIHILISTYHLSADQKLQTFLLELPVCICVVARNLRHSVSIINLRFLGKMRKK